MTPGAPVVLVCAVVVCDDERSVGGEGFLDFVARRTMDIAVAAGRVARGGGGGG